MVFKVKNIKIIRDNHETLYYSIIYLALLSSCVQAADDHRLQPFDLNRLTGSEVQQRQTLCAALTQLGETAAFSSKMPSKHLKQLVEARNAAISRQVGRNDQDSSLAAMQEKLDRKKTKLQTTRTDLDALHAEHEDLRGAHVAQTQELEHQLEEYRTILDDLNRQVQDGEAQLRLKDETLYSKAIELVEVETRYAERAQTLQGEINALRTQMESAPKAESLAELQSQLDAAQRNLQAKEAELAEAGGSHTERAQALQSEVEQLKAERAAETRQYEELFAKYTTSSEKVLGLSTDLEKMKRLHNEIDQRQQQEISKLMGTLAAAEEDIQRLTQELADAQSNLTARDLTIETLQARIQELEAALAVATQASSMPNPAQTTPSQSSSEGKRQAFGSVPPPPSMANLRSPAPSGTSKTSADSKRQAFGRVPPPPSMANLRSPAPSSSSPTNNKPQEEPDLFSELRTRMTEKQDPKVTVEETLAEHRANAQPPQEAPSILSQIKTRKAEKQKPKFSSDEMDQLLQIRSEIDKGSFVPQFVAVETKHSLEASGTMAGVLAKAIAGRRTDMESSDDENDSSSSDWSDDESTPVTGAATSSHASVSDEVSAESELKTTLKRVRNIYRLALNIDPDKKWTREQWLLWEYNSYRTDAQKETVDAAVDEYIEDNKDQLSKDYTGLDFNAIQSDFRAGVHRVQCDGSDMMASVLGDRL